MTNSLGRKYVSALCVFLMVAGPITMPGCGTASIGGGDIALSSAKLTPGQFLTISASSILKGSTVEVEFQGPEGYLVSVEAFDTQDGSVRVAVPPFVDSVTGEFRASEVTVSIKGINSQQSLMIDDMLELGDLPPGTIVRMILEAAIESSQSTLDNLALIDTNLQNSVDSSEAVAAINQEIQALQDTLNELNTTGEFVVEISGVGPVAIGGDDLRTADRVLMSMIAGVAEQSETGTASKSTSNLKGAFAGSTRKDAGDCILLETVQEKIDCLQNVVSDVMSSTGQWTNLASMAAAGVGLGIFALGAFGIIVITPEVAVTSLVVGVIGAASSFSNAAVNNQNTDSFLNNDRQGFDAGQEGASQLIRVGTSAASSLPVVGAPAQAVNVGLTVNDLLNGAESMKCSGSQQKTAAFQQVDATTTDFCTVTPLDDGGDVGTGTGDTTDPSQDDQNPTALGGFTLLGFVNTDGSSGFATADLAQAQIQLTGDPARPTISWTGVSDVFNVFVTTSDISSSNIRVLYGLEGETPPDENGDTEQVAFAFSSVTYGTYGLTNTVPLYGLNGLLGPSDAVSLSSGMVISLSITTFSGQIATLTVTVN